MAYSSFQSTKPEHISNQLPIIIMHGLMGSKTNWKSMGKAINAKTGRHVSTLIQEYSYSLMLNDYSIMEYYINGS